MAIKTYHGDQMPIRIQNQQIAAMRWLASHGVTPEQIRTFRWGDVDEANRKITLQKAFFRYVYDKETNLVYSKREVRDVALSPVGSGTEWFWFKSKIPSFFWVFLKYYPVAKRWRKEQQLDCLYPVEEIEMFIRDVEKLPSGINTNLLTMDKKFATIEVSKVNFTNQNREHTEKGC